MSQKRDTRHIWVNACFSVLLHKFCCMKFVVAFFTTFIFIPPTLKIYAEGYIVFIFLFVLVRLCIHPSIMFMEFTSEFYIKVSQVGYISPVTPQKAFMVPWRVCFHARSFGPRVHAPNGAGGQNLGHLKKCFVAFSFMLTPSYDMSEIRHSYDLGSCVIR